MIFSHSSTLLQPVRNSSLPDLLLRLTNISLAFHAVRSASELLERAGFKLIKVRTLRFLPFTVTYPMLSAGTRRLALNPSARRQILPHPQP